jgi:hypothetical protein
VNGKAGAACAGDVEARMVFVGGVGVRLLCRGAREASHVSAVRCAVGERWRIFFERGLRDWKLAAKHVGSAQVQYNGTLIVVGTDRRGLISSGTGSIIVLGCIMRCLRYVVSTTICG